MKHQLEIISSNNQLQQLVQIISALLDSIKLLMGLQRVILVELVIHYVRHVMVQLLLIVIRAGQIII